MKLRVFDLPLRSEFRGVKRRSGIVFEGTAGWAEWSPFPEYRDAEAAVWLRAALEAATLGPPEPKRELVEVNAIVPALPPAQAAARAQEANCRTIKIKVAAGELADDVARVAAVRSALPQARLRVDANGAWSLGEATVALTALAKYRLEYAEQPCAAVEDLAELRRRELGVPIAADESIRRAADPMRVRDAEAADVAVLKVQPLGGARACLRIAEELGLPVVISSALESSIGLAAGLAAAAALPAQPLACGLETGRLLAADLTEDPLLPKDGSLAVRPSAATPELLAAHAADPQLARFWLERWDRAMKLVEEGR